MRPTTRHLAAPGCAALLSMAAYCLALAVHGSYPFGARSRAVNDLGNQFVPFHARLWDLLHGTTTGDLFFNWSSGYGVPFLADFFSYLMNPFSWLVGLFPRALADFPVFLVTLFSIGLAAALMTVFLGRLRPGPSWLRALLSVGYGLCGWVVHDGAADPMWMWGLVALPLCGIAADWGLQRRRWVAGTLLIALSWAGNFYTAAMATLAMTLVLGLRLALADGMPGGDRLRALARVASMTPAGIALAAPVLTVTLRASRAAQPAPEASYDGPPSPGELVAQLLPGGHGGVHAPEAPHVYVGMLGLLLVAAFPFVRAVPLKARIGWCGLAAGITASFVWEPTILLWHGFALPNGSPYRAAFVLGGLLTMIAWLALAHRPQAGELAAGAVLVAVLAWFCRAQSSVGDATRMLVVGGGTATLAALLVLCRRRPSTAVRTGVTALLTCTVLSGSALAAFSVTAGRDSIAWFRPKTTLSEPALAVRAGLAARSDWPRSRTDPGPHEFANNDPLLLGGEGGSYYSSYLPAATARTLHGLGAGWYVKGRHTLSFEDPVGRALMGVSSSLVPVAGRPGRYAFQRSDAAPLLTVRDALPRDGGGTVFARQERVLGARVYEVPSLTPAAGPGRRGPAVLGGRAPVPDRAGWTLDAAGGTTFTGRCTPGSTVVWYAPWFSGRVSGAGGSSRAVGRRAMTANPVRVLGQVPADGTVSVRFTGDGRQHLPPHPVGCLAPRKLAAAVAALRAKGPDELTTSGHGLTATLPAGSSGSALLAVPAVPGWSCSVDGGPPRAPRSYGGLLTVPLGTGASRLACSYVPPGLAAGLAVSGGAGLAVAMVAVVAAVRGRRNRSPQCTSQTVTKHYIYRMAHQRTASEPSSVPGEKASE
ncbi:YfhO family protein [Streptomyces halobius]|uniref:YfhO family protein n=1 Tax=Streptomyces halobius TaxID=2879846 RepID=A0ABY4MBH5_9ACTN|nr:YfhO family protein [Streptomyces halobius]UQA95139.1 YfhO family protein [Streptomyces halobius]